MPADQRAKQMLNGVKVALAFGGLLVFIGFGIGSSEIMPQNAELYLDHSKRLYIAPPCISINDRSQLSLATVAEARRLAGGERSKYAKSRRTGHHGRAR